MSQSEDTELRYLVIEALEKNGSLARIRGELRANIFLAFENEKKGPKQRPDFDKLSSIPDSSLCLSIVYEFLEFFGFKNALYVYKAETMHGKKYSYEGRGKLCDKLKMKDSKATEPLLVQLFRSYKPSLEDRAVNRSGDDRGDYNVACEAPLIILDSPDKNDSKFESNNATYVVFSPKGDGSKKPEDKNKLSLNLHLQLDTDSSVDSSRDSRYDKSSNHYRQHSIPEELNGEMDNDVIPYAHTAVSLLDQSLPDSSASRDSDSNTSKSDSVELPVRTNAVQSSSSSTSYLDINAYTPQSLGNPNAARKSTTLNPIVENKSNKKPGDTEPRKSSKLFSPKDCLLSKSLGSNSIISRLSNAESSPSDSERLNPSGVFKKHSPDKDTDRETKSEHPLTLIKRLPSDSVLNNEINLSSANKLSPLSNSSIKTQSDRTSTVSEPCNYTPDFSSVPESARSSNKSDDQDSSGSILEDLAINDSSDKSIKSISNTGSPRNFEINLNSRSSISVSDVNDLIEESVADDSSSNGSFNSPKESDRNRNSGSILR